MTKQEYYDLLVESARNGVFPSYADDVCRFRMDETPACRQRCAIGLLIKDEMYDPGMEWNTIKEICDSGSMEVPEGLSYLDLSRIQSTHDCNTEEAYTWNADTFIAQLNLLPCFQEVRKVEVVQ